MPGLKNRGFLICASVAALAATGISIYWWNSCRTSRRLLCKNKRSDKPADTPSQPTNGEEHSVNERIALASAARARGNKYYNAGKIDEAINCYTESVNLYPPGHQDLALAYSNRAAGFLAKRQVSLALEDINEALSINPRFCKGLDRRSKIYEELGRFDEALEDAVAAAIIDDFKTESYFVHIEHLLKYISESQAKEQYATKEPILRSPWVIDEFLRSFPKEWSEITSDHESIIKQFYELLVGRKYEDALRSISSLSALYPKNSVVKKWHGSFQLLAGDFEKATRTLLSTIESDPQQTSAYIMLAIAYLELGRFQEMTEALDSAIKCNDADPAIYYHRGEIYALSSNLGASIADFDKAISLDKDFVLAYTHKARALMGLNLLEDAGAFLTETLTRFPDNPDVLVALGEMYAMTNSLDKAQEAFEKANRLSPNNAQILLNKAILLSSKNADADDSLVEALTKIVTEYPTFDAAHIQLAGVLLSKRRMKEALSHYDAAAANARSWQELVTIHSIRTISSCQVSVAQKYPDLEGKIQSLLQRSGPAGL